MADSADRQSRLIGPAWTASLLAVGALVLAAVWLRAGVVGSEQWPIRWLDVTGDLDRTTAAQIRGAVAPHASSGFFAVDMDTARDAVQGLPWVAVAHVRRQWPEALAVHVVEHRPLVRWNADGLISDAGELFEVAGTRGMQGLPQLSGPDGRRLEVLKTWRQLREIGAGAGLDIAALNLDPRGAWTLTLESGLEVVLGREAIDRRMQRFVAVHDDLDRQGIVRVDLRYTNGLAVTRAPEETHTNEGNDPEHG